MRFDSNRKKIFDRGYALYREIVVEISIVELSPLGCRIISENYSFTLGSVLDIKLKEIFFTGIIANRTGNHFGISLLSISKAMNENLLRYIENDSKFSIQKLPNLKPESKILILGAGSGKIFSQLEILKLIEEFSGKSIYDTFELIGGVSSGAILSTLLSLRFPLEEIRKILYKSFNTWNGINFDPFHSLLNKNFIFKEIEILLDGMSFESFSKETVLLTRSFYYGNYIYYTSSLESNYKISEAIKEAISIPVMFGLHNGMVDAAVGMYINPTECILRYLRSMSIPLDGMKIVYLDAGFDPIQRYKDKTTHLLNQLQWTLEISFRDMIISSFERVNFHFEKIKYFPFIFTFSQSYDLLKKEDAFLAEEEVRKKSSLIEKFVLEFLD